MADPNNQKINLREMVKSEHARCSVDPVYFMRRYCFIQHPKRGRMLFDLYDYQVKCLDTFKTKDYSIVLKGRQIGLSTVVACYALWMMLFRKDKNVLIIATKQDTAKNLITKVRFAYDNLPVYLQVPCPENNKLSLKFSNGSGIKAVSAAVDSARSEAVSLLVFDEAAFIKNAKEIWTAAQATLATGGKAILISTPNGTGNFFYQKYIEAEEYKDRNKEGVFYPIKLDWRVHPERDEKWAETNRTNIGPRQFRQEYEAEFLGSGNTVIDIDVIQHYQLNEVREPVMKGGIGGDEWIWELPDYSRSYMVVADVARGENSEEGDYSAYHVIDAISCTQVAEYKGRVSTTEFGHMLIAVATKYNDALLVVENGGIGWATIQTIIDRGYKNLFYMNEDLKYVDADEVRSNKLYRQDKKAVPGFTTSSRTRPLIISKLDQYMRDKTVTIRSSRTINELLTFVWENGKPIASEGNHDDLTMALSIALWVRDTALQLHQKNIEFTKLSLDRITRVSGYDGVYTPRGNVADPYKMPLGGGQEEDFRWLL